MKDGALQWMSFRRSGKIADLDSDLIGGSSVHRVLDELAALGHVEMVGRDAWRVAPPVLAELPRGSAAVLCGARTPALLNNLRTVSYASGSQISVVEQNAGPSVITVTASSRDALVHFAKSAGVPFQANAGILLLACSPSIREWPRTPFPMVEGRVEKVYRFSRSRMRWVASTLLDAAVSKKGLFRIKRDWDWISLLKNGAESASLIEDRAGRLAAAAKCKVVRWSREDGLLTLPVQLYPPTLMARGLVLCSGFLPHFDRATRRVSFVGVQSEHLRLILALTGLRLK